jgi:hypothetical protein
MTAGPLIATTRPIYWLPACKCRSVGCTVGATRIFRADGKSMGPKGDRYERPIVRVETIPGPSCDRCGKAWVWQMKQRQGAA